MLGIIVMGHGKFASGMSSTLTMIGGTQEAYTYLDFTQDKDMEQLSEELQEKISTFQGVEDLAILCDLAGGTPYKTALLYSMQHEHVHVVSGISFPLLLELCLSRTQGKKVDVLIQESIESARDNLQYFDRQQLVEQATC